MCELLSHQAPWSDMHSEAETNNWDEIRQAVSDGQRPSWASNTEVAGWCDLMQQCWQQDQETRPNAKVVASKLCDIMKANGWSIDSQCRADGLQDNADDGLETTEVHMNTLMRQSTESVYDI